MKPRKPWWFSWAFAVSFREGFFIRDARPFQLGFASHTQRIHGMGIFTKPFPLECGHFSPNWAVLSDEQMSNGYPFSLVNDEQMSNKVGVKHQPANVGKYSIHGFYGIRSFFLRIGITWDEFITIKLTTIWDNIWSNYSDLPRTHHKWWFSKENPLISGKSRLVKYYNLSR